MVVAGVSLIHRLIDNRSQEKKRKRDNVVIDSDDDDSFIEITGTPLFTPLSTDDHICTMVTDEPHTHSR